MSHVHTRAKRSIGCAALLATIILGAIATVWFFGPSFARRPMAEERSGFETTVFVDVSGPRPEPPPEELFELVRYPAPLGNNWAYVSPPRGRGRSGIVYVHGGFDWSIGQLAWSLEPRENDQSGRGFWNDQIALMLPSFRGNHDNPGRGECFFGEVEDVLAAAEFLASRPDVDPTRIYLAGHSTGATLALLAAQVSDRFRGVFAIGPASSVVDYGDASCVPEGARERETLVRSPIEFIEETRSPTFVIEGASQPSNADLLPLFRAYRGDAPVEVIEVPDLTHFSVLAPAIEVVARAVADDRDPARRLTIGPEQIVAAGAEPCGVSQLENRGASDAAPWVSRRPEEWPQLVLSNEASFARRTPLRGASAFVLEGRNGEAVIATAKHLTSWAGGVEPPLDGAALSIPSRFARQLQSWRVFPRTRPEVGLIVTGLAEPALFDDWLLLAVRVEALPETITALRLASEPAAVSDPIYLVGCPYGEQTCMQNVYRGCVTERDGNRFWYSIEPAVDVRGFSGAPILNARGRVVGIFSVTEDLDETIDGLQSEGEGDDHLLQHVVICQRGH